MRTGPLSFIALTWIFILASLSQVAAQDEFEFYHPELEWKTIETEHFYVHYHEGAERTGRTVAKISEEIYGPVTSLYGHTPDQKVSYIIKDYDDISNGAAYFYDNKIEINAPSMDFDLRGTHNWLRNVVTHEFTHIVQIQTAMKFGRTVPAIYLQWLGYESERRADVLYGFPNTIVSYPLSGFVIPVWFAEGVAQYNRKELLYDFWDSHRDMILRSYALDGNLLTWNQMGVFGKTSLGNESAYNAGLAFVSYIGKKYGDEKLNEISRNLARLPELTIDGAIERAVGRRGADVYQDWREEITRGYGARVMPIRAQIREGEPLMTGLPADGTGNDGAVSSEKPVYDIAERPGLNLACCRSFATTGFANLYPAYSPDGKKLAYVGTKDGDYFSQSSLYVFDFETKNEKLVQPGVRTSVSWSPDGSKLYYARASYKNPHWSYQFDVYVYDIDQEEEKRLTYGKRAMSPAVSPDGSTLVFVVNRDGTTNLASMNTDGLNYKLVTASKQGEQVYNPQWSPAGDRILFDYSVKDGRDIAWVRSDGSEVRFLITGDDDSRSGVFSRDGSRILFSSDRTGIFNLYYCDLQTANVSQVTNVLGGAFMPAVNKSGDIVYSGYTSQGYKIFALKDVGLLPEGNYQYLPVSDVSQISHGTSLASASNGAATVLFDWQGLRAYDDSQVPEFSSRPYKSHYTSLSVVPFIRFDNYNRKNTVLDNIKPGVYLFANDVLDKTGLFAGIALNKRFERDLFLQLNYRGKLPLLYQLGLEPEASVELYNVTRKNPEQAIIPELDSLGVDVSYNLLEFDFVLNGALLSPATTVEFRYIHSRYTSIIESFVLPDPSIPPERRLVPGSSDLYLIANNLNLTFYINSITPARTREINPVGRKISLHVARELNKFARTDSNGVREYEITESGPKPSFEQVNFTRIELTWKEHLPFFFRNHTLTASLRGGSILGPPVDEFFDFYAGGLIGMKGYPYYAIGGNDFVVLGLSYRFPIADNIDSQLLHLYFDKLYASVYADVGNAWTGGSPSLRDFKTDAGFEIRLETFSFYGYPTRIFFNAAYGFDRFDRKVPSRNQMVTYGKEWRLYFGILFGFDFD